MTRYLLRRLLQSAVVLFLFITALFFFVQILMPGDAAILLAYGSGYEQVQEYREEFGLDLPLGQQYLVWLGNILRGNLGRSFYEAPALRPGATGLERTPVFEIVWRGLLLSAMILGIGMIVAYRIGEWLGKVTAWRKGGFFSSAATLVGVVLYTTFPPLLVWLVQELNRSVEVFQSSLSPTVWAEHYLENWLWWPSRVAVLMLFTLIVTGLILMTVNQVVQRRWRWKLPMLAFAAVTLAIWFGEWAALGAWPRFMDVLRFIGIGPVICVLLFFGETMLIMRTSMIDTLYEEYVITARAKGLSERVIRDKHAARNAALPALSRLIVNLPYILTGLVIVEYSTGVGGMGSVLFGALTAHDIPVLMGSLLAIGVISLAARLLLDLVIALLDPRIRLAPSSAPQRAFERQSRGLLQMLRHLLLLPRANKNRPQPAVAKTMVSSSSLSAPEAFAARLRRLRHRVKLFWKRVGEFWRVFAENRLAVLGLILIVVFAVMAIAHPILMTSVWGGRNRAVYDPHVGFDPMIFPHPAPPSAAHPLGTDAVGRDVLSMLLAATPPTFVVALSAAAASAVIGTLIGALSAYYQGGMVDAVSGYLADMLLIMPAPIIMVIIGAEFYGDIDAFEFGLIYGVIVGASSVAIVMRALALKLMTRPFIEASRVAGAGGARIIFSHLIPHMLPLAAVQMAMTVAGAVVAYGFVAWTGITEFRLNWGAMVYFAVTFAQGFGGEIPWGQFLAPGLALSFFAASFYLVSRGLHQVAEPRLRER
jgi:ABC-type dipeptide/oligopeptide/nickel transport system permease component